MHNLRLNLYKVKLLLLFRIRNLNKLKLSNIQINKKKLVNNALERKFSINSYFQIKLLTPEKIFRKINFK